MVDQLTPEIKRNLSLPEEALKESDQKVADVTTHSTPAYRYYLEGVEFANRIYVTEAVASFEKALAYDSTFAMAYYYLARMKDPSLIAPALQFGDRATRLEQLYIRSCAAATAHNYDSAIALLEELTSQYPEEKDAFYWLGRYHYVTGDFEKAVLYLQGAIEIDPLYKLAYNLLALAYNVNGDLKESLKTVNKYISIAPDEANPYDTKGGIFADAGMFDSAIAAFQTALEIKPDFPYALIQLGHLYVFKRDFVQAESCYTVISKNADNNIKSQGEYYRVLLLIRRGRLDEALRLIDSGAIGGGHTQFPEMYAVLPLMKAQIYWARMETDKAQQAFLEAFTIYSQYFPSDSCWNRHIYAQFLAAVGETGRAYDVASQLAACRPIREDSLSSYWYALGAIESSQGNPDRAAPYFQKALEKSPSFMAQFMLGRAYLESGRYREAERLFTELLDTYSTWRLCWSIWDVEIYYYLGLSCERSGDYEKALEYYQIFVDVWDNADHELLSHYDAGERIIRLKSQL